MDVLKHPYIYMFDMFIENPHLNMDECRRVGHLKIQKNWKWLVNEKNVLECDLAIDMSSLKMWHYMMVTCGHRPTTCYPCVSCTYVDMLATCQLYDTLTWRRKLNLLRAINVYPKLKMRWNLYHCKVIDEQKDNSDLGKRDLIWLKEVESW